jgi:hypothetical protein
VLRILVLAATTAALILPAVTADAATAKKHHHHHQRGAANASLYQDYGNGQAPVRVRPHGPPWAMPNECFHDEGYGRWSPCGGRDF